MNVDQQKIINSRFGVGLGMLIGRTIPPRIAIPLISRLADFIATRRSWEMIRTVRANQWIVSGQILSSEELDQAVRETLRSTARSIYELNRYLNDPETVNRLINLNEPIKHLINLSLSDDAGFVVVGIHLGNFDLAMRSVVIQGRALILTLPELDGGYQWQFDMRRNRGIEIVPANLNTIREATSRIRDGGVVITGLDRPVQGSKYKPRFFGQPSDLPVHHILLALKAEAPIVVVASIRQADNTYQFLISEPIHMQPHPNRQKEILTNAEEVLKVAEDFIRQAPSQWSIFHPVWPGLIDDVPR